MQKPKLPSLINLSNQANFIQADKSKFSQFNFVCLFGLGYLFGQQAKAEKIPIKINIDQSGEVMIEGVSEQDLRDHNKMRIYSDKKITTTSDKKNIHARYHDQLKVKGDETGGKT